MTENRTADTHVLDDIIASVTNRLLVDEDEAKLIAKLMKKVLYGGASVEDVTRHRTFDAGKLEDLIQAARTELQRRESEIALVEGNRTQHSESRHDSVLIETENHPATHTHVSPSPRMKKLLAAKRRINATAATNDPDRDARVCKSIVSPVQLEGRESQCTSSVLNKLEQIDRGQSLEEDADRRNDDAGVNKSLTSGASASDVSSGMSGVADHCHKTMDEEMLKEYGFAEIYIHVNRPALVDDPQGLINDDVQRYTNDDHDSPGNQEHEAEPSESSSDTLEAHSGIGFQASATAPPAVPLKYTTDDAAGTFTCDYCQQVLNSMEDVAEHYITLHEPTSPAYRCEMCGAHCKDQESLARHVRRKHDTAVRRMKKINVPRYEAFAAELPAFQASTSSGN